MNFDIKEEKFVYKAKPFKINDINLHISCYLCNGYLIDATTIIECLHSFCRSCIVIYLKTNNKCPICQILIHKTKPMINIRNDTTLQDLTYKLIPGLYLDEKQKRKDYFLKSKKKIKGKCEFNKSWMDTGNENYYNIDFLSCDDDVNIKLSYYLQNSNQKDFNSIEKALSNYSRFLQTSIMTTTLVLRKFLQKKFNVPFIDQIELYHMNEYLADNQSLLDIICVNCLKRDDSVEIYFYIHEIYIEEEEIPPDLLSPTGDLDEQNVSIDKRKGNKGKLNHANQQCNGVSKKQNYNRDSILSSTTSFSSSDGLNTTFDTEIDNICNSNSNQKPTPKFTRKLKLRPQIDSGEDDIEDDDWNKDLMEKVDKACRKTLDISPPPHATRPSRNLSGNVGFSAETLDINSPPVSSTQTKLLRPEALSYEHLKEASTINRKQSDGQLSREMAETLLKLRNGRSD